MKGRSDERHGRKYDQTFAALPQWQIVEAMYLELRSLRETAQVLGVSRNRVWEVLQRMKQARREGLA